ncbi:DNA-directed RNA polymerase subunit alpha [Spirochaetota bacterium]|nr:DNA-directed RNA polymerase subunit alpha [Spirochaetota bacterium]
MISTKLVSDFKRPKGVQYKPVSDEGQRAEFSAGPYERGFAVTIGNALRRTLLSGLPGYAIVAVHFDKISSEFENIPGVVEDTTVICVNLKKVAIGMKDVNVKNKILTFDIKGKTTFTARDIARDESLVIGNPDHVIFEANEDAEFSFKIQISQGRGYVGSEVIERNIETRGTIPLDANYSPVSQASFEFAPMAMSAGTEFERLIIAIETNGVMLPQDALVYASRILKECFMTFDTPESETVTTPIDITPLDNRSDKDKIFHASVHSLDFSIPTHYFFKVNNITEVGELVMENEDDLRTLKYFKDEILTDISNQLKTKSLSLSMKNINYIKKKY